MADEGLLPREWQTDSMGHLRAWVGKAEALAQEVEGWKANRVNISGYSKMVRTRARDGAYGQKSTVLVDPGRYWGWLDPKHMGAEGDGWKLILPFKELTWVEAELPKAWLGTLYKVSPGGEEGTWLMGHYETQINTGAKKAMEGEHWAVPMHKGRAPYWPDLNVGDFGEGVAKAMVLLGVLRVPVFLPNEDWQIFKLAWGDREGNFLGWEETDCMTSVHQIAPESIREFGPLREWEKVETELRSRSAEREI
jgi:hypothetical protein